MAALLHPELSLKASSHLMIQKFTPGDSSFNSVLEPGKIFPQQRSESCQV